MADKYKLSEGALAVLMRGDKIDNPIMQVLGSKKLATNDPDKERHRMMLSDGKYLFSFAMFTNQISNSILLGGDFEMFSIIKIKRSVTSEINKDKSADKKILVIMDFEFVAKGSEVGYKIGNPEQLPANLSKESTDPPKPMQTNANSTARMKTSVPSISGINLNNTMQGKATHSISTITPYQNKWVIKARVTNKSNIRTWKNAKGEGSLFSFDLLDESGEIRVTAFKESVDKYYDIIQVDKVYYISKCMTKMANKQYSSLKNDYELTLTNDSVVQECEEETDIPTTKYDFVTIDKLANMEVGTIVDCIGIVKQASDVQTFTAKSSGRELKKRELIIVDPSKASVSVTLWGDTAENYDYTLPVVVIKGGKIGEFGGGKNLAVSMNGFLKYNPDIPEAFSLRGWYDNGGCNEEASNISARSNMGGFQANWMSFREVKDQDLGNVEKGYYYQTAGTVILVRAENIFYKACPQENCNKKIVDLENGTYRCEKCSSEYPNFKYRLLGNVNVGDWSGNQWVSMFSSELEILLGKTAQEVGEIAETDNDGLMQITNEANFKQYTFRCRAKMEKYNDEARLKTVAIKVEPLNYKEYNSHLISRIQQLAS
ncbi:PREDICTED: replication protein A 70 kDa DNA-binding subunit [Nicrophorus vespilloides]|uniref:Replication protein A subunit n=1 Tax=Nicrophorus vespilloides TaxID=110193 RepID=A0ABM1MAS4_NICVS|nr:PREDICTED: replication protein A 70 kDa DNA-binding subunit [Nicrophorus vespilloides]